MCLAAQGAVGCGQGGKLELPSGWPAPGGLAKGCGVISGIHDDKLQQRGARQRAGDGGAALAAGEEEATERAQGQAQQQPARHRDTAAGSGAHLNRAHDSADLHGRRASGGGEATRAGYKEEA